MLKSLLIANRGEIARRVIRTACRLGVRTIAVYSEADAGAPHVQEADAAVLIGPPPATESYLSQVRILEAAAECGADAVHPGYGFLSENAEFADAVLAAGLVWVGPPPAAIRAMGLKDAAKRLMMAAGVPVTPGYLGEDQSPRTLQREADAIGYPMLIKAVAGGGGMGMRKVDAAADFAAALASCRREAAASFGDDRVLLERYVARPRHIEVQIFGDRQGEVVHLFERDCSLQRRRQKVIEEAPAPGMSAEVRAGICAAAIKAARAVGYEGAGTVEFIADASQGLRADGVWFMEMNTRLQVEHPVTEAITGVDLVEWQLRIASGEPLPLRQDQIAINGWAMEARLYAENPAAGFLPSTGPLTRFRLPDHDVRIDSGVQEGGEVSAFYDPMIAKLIVHAETREGAAAKLAQACGSVEAWPVKTNAGFLARCASHPDFIAGAVDTGFIADRQDALVTSPPPTQRAVEAAAFALLAAPETLPSPWSSALSLAGFRLNDRGRAPVRLAFGTQVLEVDAALTTDLQAIRQGPDLVVFEAGEAFVFREPGAITAAADGPDADGEVRSPMPGKVIAVSVAAGDAVIKGQSMVVLEAMKMEHALAAPWDGIVAALNARPGDQVSEGMVLVRLQRPA